MKSLLSVFCFLIFHTQANKLELLKDKKITINFHIKNAGVKIKGAFKEYHSTIYWDTLNLQNASIEVNIHSNSIKTAFEPLDNHLKKQEYFDVKNHELMSAKSISFTKISPKNYQGLFEFNLKGTTKRMTITFPVSNNIIKMQFALNRQDFKVGPKTWLLSDLVYVNIDIDLIQ